MCVRVMSIRRWFRRSAVRVRGRVWPGYGRQQPIFANFLLFTNFSTIETALFSRKSFFTHNPHKTINAIKAIKAILDELRRADGERSASWLRWIDHVDIALQNFRSTIMCCRVRRRNIVIKEYILRSRIEQDCDKCSFSLCACRRSELNSSCLSSLRSSRRQSRRKGIILAYKKD